jgi:hypothetical protein
MTDCRYKKIFGVKGCLTPQQIHAENYVSLSVLTKSCPNNCLPTQTPKMFSGGFQGLGSHTSDAGNPIGD